MYIDFPFQNVTVVGLQLCLVIVLNCDMYTCNCIIRAYVCMCVCVFMTVCICAIGLNTFWGHAVARPVAIGESHRELAQQKC